MLNRQKTLLHILRTAVRPVSRYELTKWSFLLRYDYPSAGGSAFYDFLPYRYGPFSFTLYQELDKLEGQCYIRSVDENKYNLEKPLADSVAGPGRAVEQDVEDVLDQFSSISKERLTDYVYENFPSYTVNSEIRQLEPRPITDPAIFTAGYEKRSVDAFFHLLVQSGIRRLIDVRKNPVARRYGFHRNTLDRLGAYLGIEYIHFPNLGIASEKRQELNTVEDYTSLFADYEKTTLREESSAIDEVVKLMFECPSVLVCMEANPICCHRTRLADVVAKRSGLPIRHLGTLDAA